MKKKVLLVDTIPANARNQGSINVGFEIVRHGLDADVCHWRDVIEKKKIKSYDKIAFNVFYPMHLFNIVPFLRKNGIEPLKGNREAPYLVAGGQGVGMNHILSGIVDEEFVGEFDAKENAKSVTSGIFIKDGKAVIELTRGCKYRCSFCEYGHVHGGKYREKELSLVKKQIEELLKLGINKINFLSANFAGYSRIVELIEYCRLKLVQILNSDSCLNDIEILLPYAGYLSSSVKIGVESFDEATRKRVQKNIDDERLTELVLKLSRSFHYLHFYLIYGLPGDNYSSWFSWLKRLKKEREKYSTDEKDLFGGTYKSNDKNIRYEFNITNFEPCPGTPLEDAEEVDFVEKDKFLKKWVKVYCDCGFSSGKIIRYENSKGRLGRKEMSYKVLMALKNGGPELTNELIYALPNGVGRSLKDDDAAKFLFFRES